MRLPEENGTPISYYFFLHGINLLNLGHTHRFLTNLVFLQNAGQSQRYLTFLAFLFSWNAVLWELLAHQKRLPCRACLFEQQSSRFRTGDRRCIF